MNISTATANGGHTWAASLLIPMIRAAATMGFAIAPGSLAFVGHQESADDTGDPRRRNRCVARIVLPFLLAGIATEGHAAPMGSETTQVRVRYDHRTLSSPAAARSLLKRIGDAALESCGASSFSLAELKAATRASRCWKDAVDDAVRRIGSPVLTAAANEEH